jgi:DNA-binding beta-propeller fold protein YncE
VNDVTGRLYATSLPPGKGTDDTAELLEFDLSTLGQTRSFATPGFQANLIVDEASNLVYSLGGRVVPGADFNQLLLIDPASGRIDDIDPGLPPQRGVFHRQTSKFYTPMVESNGNRTLGVVRGRTPALVPIDLGGSFTVADLDIAENLDRVYAGSGNRIFVIDSNTDLLIDTITISFGAGVEAIGFNPATRHLFVATFLGIEVYDVDGDVNEIITTLPMGVTAFYDDVAVDAQNGLVAFSNAGDRTIVVIRDDIDLTVETFPGIRRARSAPRHGLHFDPATARLYLLDTIGGSVISIGPLR